MASNSPDALPERYLTIGDCKIRYLDYDSRDNNSDIANVLSILLLLHGIGASSGRWHKVAQELAKYYRVIVPDIIGFGYSCKPKNGYTIDFFIDFLEKFLRNLHIINDIDDSRSQENSKDTETNKMSMIGSSFGGLLAAEFAFRFSNILDKLVLVSPVGSSMPSSTPEFDFYRLAAHTRYSDDALRAFRAMFYDPDHATIEMVKDFLKRMHEENAILAFDSTLLAIKRHSQDSRNLRQKLSKICNPSLIVWGRNDRIIPFQCQLIEYLEIPNVELKIINECGHVPFVEKPTEFNEIVLDFLLKDPSRRG